MHIINIANLWLPDAEETQIMEGMVHEFWIH